MGLFDKIKDNARNISIKALEDADSYEKDNQFEYQKPEQDTVASPVTPEGIIISPTIASNTTDDDISDIDESAIDTGSVEIDTSENVAVDTEKTEKKEPRKSKVTEISKAEHEKAEKEKKQTKAKQEAKERLAKAYVPSYKSESTSTAKSTSTDKADKEKTKKSDDASTKTTKPIVRKKSIGIIDVAPNKFQTPTKSAVYTRERVAMNIIASQRKLNGTVPLYTASHMSFKTRVFIDRIEYSGSFGKTAVPINKVAWVKLRFGGTGVIIETTEGKRIVMVVKPSDRLSFADAILRVQSLQPKKAKFKDNKTVRIDQLEKISEGVDEIEKLAKLYDKGILTQEEFETKKKQILGL